MISQITTIVIIPLFELLVMDLEAIGSKRVSKPTASRVVSIKLMLRYKGKWSIMC